MQVVNKKSPLYQNAFYEVFKSIQLSSAYTLYYDIDFSKRQVQNFQKILTSHNAESLEHKISEGFISNGIIKSLNFDCMDEAMKFPFRAKLKMYGKKYKQKDINTIVTAGTDAICTYLILSIYTLHKHYHFNKEKVRDWYNHMVEFCKLYAEGLTDNHVIEYFMQECELEITED